MDGVCLISLPMLFLGYLILLMILKITCDYCAKLVQHVHELLFMITLSKLTGSLACVSATVEAVALHEAATKRAAAAMRSR